MLILFIELIYLQGRYSRLVASRYYTVDDTDSKICSRITHEYLYCLIHIISTKSKSYFYVFTYYGVSKCVSSGLSSKL